MGKEEDLAAAAAAAAAAVAGTAAGGAAAELENDTDSLQGSLGLASDGEDEGGSGSDVHHSMRRPPGWRGSEDDEAEDAFRTAGGMNLGLPRRDDIRERIRRQGGGGGRGRGSGRGGRGGKESRNMTKKVNLYGRKVKQEKIDF